MAEEPVPARQRRFTKPIELADLDLAKINVGRRLKVFLAGPFIERGWTDQQRAEKEASALLRVDLAAHIQGVLGHDPVFGEHRGVLEVAEDRLRSRSSPVLLELTLVKSTCDAVIVIPASPGSYSELGAWSVFDDVCRKMLILANKSFEGKGGYVSTGVFKTAVDHGARVAWIDYEDVAEAVKIVDNFVGEIQDAVLARSIIHG
jgi:hypothetical protein